MIQPITRLEERRDACKAWHETEYVIAWFDPLESGVAKISYPGPDAMGELMLGGIFPPLFTYLRARTTHDKADWAEVHYGPRAEAMTEEEAVNYLLCVMLPIHIWAVEANRAHFRICKKQDIAGYERFRNSMELA